MKSKKFVRVLRWLGGFVLVAVAGFLLGVSVKRYDERVGNDQLFLEQRLSMEDIGISALRIKAILNALDSANWLTRNRPQIASAVCAYYEHEKRGNLVIDWIDNTARAESIVFVEHDEEVYSIPLSAASDIGGILLSSTSDLDGILQLSSEDSVLNGAHYKWRGDEFELLRHTNLYVFVRNDDGTKSSRAEVKKIVVPYSNTNAWDRFERSHFRSAY